MKSEETGHVCDKQFVSVCFWLTFLLTIFRKCTVRTKAFSIRDLSLLGEGGGIHTLYMSQGM